MTDLDRIELQLYQVANALWRSADSLGVQIRLSILSDVIDQAIRKVDADRSLDHAVHAILDDQLTRMEPVFARLTRD